MYLFGGKYCTNHDPKVCESKVQAKYKKSRYLLATAEGSGWSQPVD